MLSLFDGSRGGARTTLAVLTMSGRASTMFRHWEKEVDRLGLVEGLVE